jgi:tetratricopeptide (TPR) repeat protein
MPTSPCVFYRERGELHFGRGNYAQAVNDYTTHFTVILARTHDNDYIYRRRAAAYFELNRFDEALADLNRAFEIHPDDLSALTWISPAKLARCHDAKFRTAVLQLADRAVELNEGSVASRLVRSSLLLEMGQMVHARADLSAIMKGDVTANYESYLSVLLALKLGDIGAYQELCQDYVSAAEKSDEPMAMHFAAWTAALVPDALTDYEPAIALAEASVEAAPKDRQFQTGLAAIQMRAGLYEQALASLEKSKQLESTSRSSDAYAAFFQAITQHHLGRTSLARESLAEATALADQELSDETKRPGWNRILTLKLLREEAEALLKNAEHNDAEPTNKPEETRSNETSN